jgi:hypothetical protein
VIDGFLPKLEELLIEQSKGKIRADVAHAKIMGYSGSERTTRRTVARMKDAWRADRRRVWRPWLAEPGMWAEYDFGDGPSAGGRRRCCPACGWPGRGSGSYCRRWTFRADRKITRSWGCRVTSHPEILASWTFQHYVLGTATVWRIGFGAMQLPGPAAFGPPRDAIQIRGYRDDVICRARPPGSAG